MDFLQRGGGTTDLTKKQACAVWKEDHHIKTPTFVIRGCEITPYNRRKKRRHEKINMIFSQRPFVSLCRRSSDSAVCNEQELSVRHAEWHVLLNDHYFSFTEITS